MAISPRDAVIVDGLRTPVGKLRGALGSVRPDDLGGHAIRSLLARTPLAKSNLKYNAGQTVAVGRLKA